MEGEMEIQLRKEKVHKWENGKFFKDSVFYVDEVNCLVVLKDKKGIF